VNNFIHRGGTLDVTAPYAVLSGSGLKIGNLFGVAANTQAIGDSMEMQVEGVFQLTKDASVFAQGDLVYWDDVAKKCTSTVGANLLIGGAEVAQLTGDATVQVKLFGVPGFSGQANGLRVAHFLYNSAVDGGASCTPANSDTIPANAVVYGGAINSASAVTAAGAATVAVTTVAGSGAGSILAATGKATLSIDAVVVPTCSATPFKMTAAGQICIVVATGPLTAGLIEGWVLYSVANEA